MSIPDPVMDEDFVFAPTFLVEGPLDEGKAIGTAKHADLVLLKNLLHGTNVDPGSHAKEVKQGNTVGRKKLAEIQDRTRRALVKLLSNYDTKKVGHTELRKQVVATMKTAWRDTFLAGIRAAGVPGSESGHGKVIVPSVVPAMDEAWLKSAMAHEMGFLNKFLDDVITGTTVMPAVTRAKMYVDALESFYVSARVIGLPQDVVLWWVGPHDHRSCAGCKYLFAHAPYSKLNLPTTPRAGLTPCLTNCRDRILVRRGDPGEAAAIVASAKYTRGSHIANLRAIKRTGKPLP